MYQYTHTRVPTPVEGGVPRLGDARLQERLRVLGPLQRVPVVGGR